VIRNDARWRGARLVRTAADGVTLHIDSLRGFFRVDPDIFKKLQNISVLVIFAGFHDEATFFPLDCHRFSMRKSCDALRINGLRWL
jgi:hypothetical protein